MFEFGQAFRTNCPIPWLSETHVTGAELSGRTTWLTFHSYQKSSAAALYIISVIVFSFQSIECNACNQITQTPNMFLPPHECTSGCV